MSDLSQADAQAHADARTREAFERIWAGEDLPRREQRAAYLGSEGVPIREEILQRHDAVVVTRNRYGAHCLNTPDTLIADVDLDVFRVPHLSFKWSMIWLVLSVAMGWGNGHPFWGVGVGLFVLWLAKKLLAAHARRKFDANGGPRAAHWSESNGFRARISIGGCGCISPRTAIACSRRIALSHRANPPWMPHFRSSAWIRCIRSYAGNKNAFAPV